MRMMGMTRKHCVAGGLAAFALAAVLAGASARAADSSDLEGPQNLFISPSGEPFTASVDDPYPIVKWFKRMDKKGDGMVDRDEFRADALTFFDTLDRNHDGILGQAEIQVYEHTIVPEILYQNGTPAPAAQDDDTPQKLTPDQGAAFYGLFQEPEPVMSADRNFDFLVSRQEFLDQADRHFRALDVKGKGYLTLSDLPQTPAEKATHARRIIAGKAAKSG
jgi:hypothetical protein